MRVALGLLIALLLGGVAAAGVDWSKYPIPPPAQPAPLDAGATLAPVSLTRMAANLRDGDQWAELWSVCSGPPERVLTWEAENNQFSADRKLQAVFRQELAAAGFKVTGASTDLFQTEAPSSDLEVGALITKLHVSECASPVEGARPRKGRRSSKGPFDQMGAAVMGVEWQIYSVSQAKLLARIDTEGGFKDNQTGPLLAPYIVRTFAENVRQLAASAEFRRIVTAPAAPAAAAPPAIPVAFRTTAASLPLAEAAKGAVSVIVAKGWGSGVLISPEGYILTNYHVVGDDGGVRIRWSNGQESAGRIVRSDRSRDVALLKTEAPQGVALAIRTRPVELGEAVYAIGTPRERAFAGTLTRGVISSVDRKIAGQHYIQSDVAVTHGDSGGPLLDDKGAIVALADMVYEPGGVGQNINFFIPIGEALKALAIEPAGDHAGGRAGKPRHTRRASRAPA